MNKVRHRIVFMVETTICWNLLWPGWPIILRDKKNDKMEDGEMRIGQTPQWFQKMLLWSDSKSSNRLNLAGKKMKKQLNDG